MNSKTAKLLRKYSIMLKMDYEAVKSKYNGLNATERKKVLKKLRSIMGVNKYGQILVGKES